MGFRDPISLPFPSILLKPVFFRWVLGRGERRRSIRWRRTKVSSISLSCLASLFSLLLFSSALLTSLAFLPSFLLGWISGLNIQNPNKNKAPAGAGGGRGVVADILKKAQE